MCDIKQKPRDGGTAPGSRWTVAQAGRHTARKQLEDSREVGVAAAIPFANLACENAPPAVQKLEGQVKEVKKAVASGPNGPSPLTVHEYEKYKFLTGKPLPQVKHVRLNDLVLYRNSHPHGVVQRVSTQCGGVAKRTVEHVLIELARRRPCGTAMAAP